MCPTPTPEEETSFWNIFRSGPWEGWPEMAKSGQPCDKIVRQFWKKWSMSSYIIWVRGKYTTRENVGSTTPPCPQVWAGWENHELSPCPWICFHNFFKRGVTGWWPSKTPLFSPNSPTGQNYSADKQGQTGCISQPLPHFRLCVLLRWILGWKKSIIWKYFEKMRFWKHLPK